MASLSQLIVKITADSSGFERSIASAQRSALKMAEGFEAAGSVLTRALTLPVGVLGGGALKAAADFEGLRRGLEAVTGSAEKASQQFVSLKKVAELPGLGFREAVQGSINLQAAGFSAATAERALKAFGNALATVGKGRAELDGVILALSQIQAKGKFSAEELNQLAERLPQIRTAVKAAFGTGSTEEIQKLGLTSEQIIGRIIEQFEKLPQVSGGLNNSFENLRDSIERAAAGFGQLLAPAAEAAAGVISDFAVKLENAAVAARSLPQPIKDTAVGIAAIAASAGVVATLAAGFARLSVALTGVAGVISGPLGLAATGLVLNLGNIKQAWERLRDEIQNDAFLKAIQGRFPEMSTAAAQTASDLRFFAEQNDEAARAALALSFSQAQTNQKLKEAAPAAEAVAKQYILMKAINFADKSADNELFAASISRIADEADKLKREITTLREQAEKNPFEFIDGPSIVNGVDNFAKLITGAAKYNDSLKTLEERSLRFVEGLQKQTTAVRENRDILDFVNAGGVGKLPSNLGNSTPTIPSMQTAKREMSEFSRQVSTVVTDFSRGIADIVVKGESVGKVFRGIGEQIATALVRVAVERGIKLLVNSLDGVISKLGTLGRAFADVFGTASSAVGGVATAAGSAGSAAGSAAGAAGGVAGGIAAGGAMGAVGAISQAVTAVFSALQFLQGRRMEQDIGRIEVTSRGQLNQLISIQQRLDQYLPNLLNTSYLINIDEKLSRLYEGLGAVDFSGARGGNTINITVNGGNDARTMAQSIVRELRLISPAFS